MDTKEERLDTDEQLAIRVRDGDDSAAEALFKRYFPLLRSQVRRHLSPQVRRKVAESDVIQEAFLAVLTRLNVFQDRGAGSFDAWLRGILNHKTKDQLRLFVGAAKRDIHREYTQGGEAAVECQDPDRATPSMELAEAEARSELLRAVDSLSENHRSVLQLVHFKGLSLKDAAEVLGRTPNTTRVLYARAVALVHESTDGGSWAPAPGFTDRSRLTLASRV